MLDRLLLHGAQRTAAFDGKEVMRAELTQGLSQDPGITFPLKVHRSGKLTVIFVGTTGKQYLGQGAVRIS